MERKISKEMLSWNNGVPMGAARYHYIPPEMRARREGNLNISAVDTVGTDVQKAAPKGISGLEALAIAFKAATPIMMDRHKIENECQMHLFRGLREGHLQSFAFEFPRKFNSDPVSLDYEHWLGETKWKTNELHCHGLRLIEVRVIATQFARQILDERNLIASQLPPPRGRPSVKGQVEQAFDALNDAGAIDPSLSAKSQYPKIRAWLAENSKNLSIDPLRINDETIRRITAPLFNKLKIPTNKQ